MTKREAIIATVTALIDLNPAAPEDAMAFLETHKVGKIVLDYTALDVISSMTIRDMLAAVIESNKTEPPADQ